MTMCSEYLNSGKRHNKGECRICDHEAYEGEIL